MGEDEPGVRSGDSATETEASGILEVGTKFKSWLRKKRLLMLFKDRCTASFTFSPKLVNKVPDDMKYTFVMFTYIHGGRAFKSRPKNGSRPLQM